MGLGPSSLSSADRNLVLSSPWQAKSGSALTRVDARKGIRPMEINKTAI